MPFHFEYDSEHRILLIVAEGEFGDEDQISIVDEVRKHAARLDVAASIGDYTELGSYTASPDAIRAAALQPPLYSPAVRRFMVAPLDHVFGASRMYAALSERSRSQLTVVRSRAEALELLGVPDPRFLRVDEAPPPKRNAGTVDPGSKGM